MEMDKYADELVDRLTSTLFTASNDGVCSYDVGIRKLVAGFVQKKKELARVFFIGNGGSAAIASHMTADFMKNGGIRTCSLYDMAVMTCMGNDYGYEHIFSKPLGFLADQGDLLVAISSSGKSRNIIEAIKTAREKKANVYTFTGFEENNPVRGMGDVNVYVPCSKYGMVESIHNLILQEVVDRIFDGGI